MTPPKGKPAREEDLLVDLSQSSARQAPEIPTLSKKKEEKKGAGVPVAGGASSPGGGGFLARWFGVGARGGGGFSTGGAATVARSGIGAAGKLGFGPMLVNFLASNFGAVLLTGLITGGAVYTLYSLGMNAMAETPAKARVFPTGEKGAAGGDGAESRVDASGLSFFASANQGMAFQQPTATTADAPAEETPSDAPAAEEGPVAEAQGEVQQGSGPQIADALAKALPKPKMIAARGARGGGLGGGNGLAGGAGLSGGMMKKFDPKGDDLKKSVTAMRRDPSAKLTARRMAPVNRAKSGSLNQLRFANSTSRKALGQTSGEAQSFQAAEAFNTAPIGQGANAITGSGTGAGDGGDGVGPSTDDGGPIGRTGEEPAPDTGKKEDKSPYSQALMMAMALLMTASTLITIIGILAIIKKVPIIGVIAEMWQKILYGAAIAMAASAAAVGAMVASQYGQKDQGMIVTVGGAITSAAATAALISPRPEAAWLAVLGGIAGMASSIGALLVPMMGGGMGAGAGGSSAAKK